MLNIYRYSNLSDVFGIPLPFLNMNIPHSCVSAFLQLCLLTGPHFCTVCVCVCVCVFSSHPVWCEQDIPKPAKRKCQNTSAQPAMNINALTEKGRGRELAHPKGEYTHHAELYRQDFLKVYLISKEYISKKHYCNSTQWRLVHLHYLHLTLWRIVTTTDV